MDKFAAQFEKSQEAHNKVPIDEVIMPCVWSQDNDGIYFTKCGDLFYFETGGVKENKFKFCPYCGFRIKQARQ